MALGFYFDMTRCIGCKACQVACKDKNNLDIGTLFRNAATYELGSFPKVQHFNYSCSCNHCENPACVAACASGACYKDADGCVIIDAAMCDGCGMCVEICPYKAPKMVGDVAVKCDACAYLRAKGQKPACVDACPNRALDFGDVEELKAKYGADLVSDLTILPDSTMTKANVYIKAKACALEGEAVELPM